MPTFLTQAWLDALVAAEADLPPVPGATVRIQHVVPKAPGGEASYTTSVVDGRVVEAALGTDESAELTLLAEYKDAVPLATGELDPDVAFMRGRLKVTGRMADYLKLVPVHRSEEFRAARAALGAATDLPT